MTACPIRSWPRRGSCAGPCPIEAGPAPASSALLLYFDREPHLPRQYRGMVERLGGVLRTALIHRQLFARTLESERALHRQKTLLESLSEASVEGILIASPGRKEVLTHNRRFVEMWRPGGEEIQSASNEHLAPCNRRSSWRSPPGSLARAASFFEHRRHVGTR